VVSGLATQADFGTAAMGKLVMTSMMRAFLDAGQYTGQDKIIQIPYVSISTPTVADEFQNPSAVDIGWGIDWVRWDGEKYTDEYAAGYTDSATVVYHVKYSADTAEPGDSALMTA